MTHPEDLLAQYVDGTLTQDERAGVDAHLADCASCREEVELAGRAVASLSALAEEPVPFGVTGPVLAEARRRAPRTQPVWQRYQWAAGLAAAACLVLAAVVVLPQITGGNAGDGVEERATPATLEVGGDAVEGAVLGPTLQTEVLDQNLDERDLKRIAREAVNIAPATPQGESTATFVAPDDAISCILTSGATIDERDVLVRLLEARYLGTPAYVGVFHEGPGGGQPPQRVVVWVVPSANCQTALTFISLNI